ncbi:MAG: 4Fe-4S ferredoxin [Acidobacteria bacterium]|nr:4Fe-4S ferredoxin [Acidobacteriota bacterium]MBI3489390.1 4Fe-4S ferredoxin [Acidobacteriota bacterium]
MRWYTLLWVLLLSLFIPLGILLATTALAEHEFRAVAVSLGATLLIIGLILLLLALSRRGALESLYARRGLKAGLAVTALFTASLVIPSEASLPRKDIRRFTTGTQAYDASTQPGNEIFTQIEKKQASSDKDVMTFSIFDVCVGKVSHRVSRDGEVSPNRVEVINPGILTQKLKADAKALGADVVGITELDPRFVFQKDNEGNPVRLKHRYAIVLGKGLDYKLSHPTAPLPWQSLYSSIPEEVAAVLSGRQVQTATQIPEETLNEYRETLEFFSDGGRTAVELASLIRSYGYPARAHFGRWSEVQVVPLAIMAGLGELGKNGMLVNPAFGPRGSFPIVTTDLPLIPDRQVDLGIQEFCRACAKCADACPPRAVPQGDPALVNGLLRWQVDGTKCFSYIKTNPKCMACVGACPYNKKDYFVHRLAVTAIARKSRVMNWLMLRLDNLLGYGARSVRVGQEARKTLVRVPQ